LNTYNVAIIGAGPAGYFAAQAIQNQENESQEFKVDLYEKLPTPWGLVRSGVAPDHQKIKTVSKVFEKIASNKNFRLFANVELGVDVFIKDLKRNYDAVVLATGASKGKKLNIPGENLRNCFSSADFVSWYNAHPDFANLDVDLDTDRAIVIGVGNVAIDVARILIKDVKELENTDIAIHALEKLKKSGIKEVVICGRRGPEHAQFTAPELRELPKIVGVNIDFDQSQVQDAIARTKINGLYDEKEIRTNLETMHEISKTKQEKFEKTLKFRFLLNPHEVIGESKVSKIDFNVNIVEKDTIKKTKKRISLDCGLVISAIGYESFPIDSLKPIQGKFENSGGKIEDNLYVVGWAKRGSTGVIGTNKSDASDVIDLLISNLKPPKNFPNPEKCIQESTEFINQKDWEKINKKEIEFGVVNNKPRIKLTGRSELIGLSR
jgi:ferredoxin--NADP+ reductase